jgi:GNAT superfamily N-acetyltransferase
VNGREPFADLVMRPVEERDVEAIVAMFRRLSPQSLYFRFMTLMPDPTRFVVDHVARVDGYDHGALVVLDGADAVAVAQWDRTRGHPDDAEMAITIDDPWQHRGLGRALARVVAGEAHRHGVVTLTAHVLSENQAARGLALRQGPSRSALDGTETSFTYQLAS